MQLPDISSPRYERSDSWCPVETGRTEPDEYQAALMKVVKDALDKGVFYNTDMRKYVQEHNDFIPSEWWDLQYKKGHEVEGGIMGMEIYNAREAVKNKIAREENFAAMKSITVGQKLGVLYVNTKRANKCEVVELMPEHVVFDGTCGSRRYRFTVQARAIPGMIERAERRGWRKPCQQ